MGKILSTLDFEGRQGIENLAAATAPGQPVTFEQLPTELPPTAHGHSIGDVSGLAAALNDKLATAAFTWSNLGDKPSTFSPSAHGHAIGDVSGLATALNDKLATAAFTWSNLGDKPSTFTPSAHSHSTGDVTGFVSAVRTLVEASLTAGDNVSLTPSGSGDTLVIQVGVTLPSPDPANLAVRYDAIQPEQDCLWVSPTGQVVLITGSP